VLDAGVPDTAELDAALSINLPPIIPQ